MAKDVLSEKYWDSEQVAAFIGVKPNNLWQITSRELKVHTQGRHPDNGKCACLLVTHKGRKIVDGKSKVLNFYRREKVEGYALRRAGAFNPIQTVVKRTRASQKVQSPRNSANGRPSMKE